ncbi:MAG: primosomal protein N' [Clostridia bacterium]|nr:primosomal protein N' [Clostridia bacterium]
MFAEVIVDIKNSEVDKVFDYLVPQTAVVGQRVLVPFGPRKIEGYIVKLKEKSDVAVDKIKSIISLLDDEPLILPEMLLLSDFMIKKNHLKRVDTLRLFLPSGIRQEKIKPLLKEYVFVKDFNKDEVLTKIRKNSFNQLKLLEFVEPQKEYEKSELNKMFGASAVEKFVQMGIFLKDVERKLRTPDVKQKDDKVVVLNEAQKQILEKIKEPKVHLIFGVTGSGKTEIYMHSIKRCLNEGKTAIMLVPEIGLTPQVSALFKARFGGIVAILHSGLSMGERYDEWQRIRSGDAKIVVGARSAIFAPLKNIGIIIIDEEHDGSYKSDSNPRFYTHDIAEFRAKYNNCPLVLGSATPSIDSYYKAKTGEYELHELLVRANQKEMPKVQIVDMKQELLAGNSSMFSRQLQSDLAQCINSKNQSMLFCNRRGFASYMVCKQCGWTAKCEDCDATLVYHKEDNLLKCHFCNRRYKAITNCPNCGSNYIKMGTIGTQKVAEELKKMFPNVKVLRMDFDTTSKKSAHAEILEEFSKTKPCILVGTQMIAKGHDFPNVTLVGIIEADMSMHYSDFRSSERTFQLLTQVAGRAGRADKTGKIVLQTYMPHNYVYRYMANYDYKSFFEKEINVREVSKFPPFAYIVRVLISGENLANVQLVTANIHTDLKNIYEKNQEILFCQAMKSPVSKIQNKHRYQIILRLSQKGFTNLIDLVYNSCEVNSKQGVSVFVEINPNNMS